MILATSLSIKGMYFTLIALVFAASGTAFAQGYVMPSEPVLVSMPKAVAPTGAWLRTSGNIVRVSVSIDKKGKVVSVDSIDGPGFTCSESTLPDLLLLREAAKQTALRAVFTPAMVGKKTFPSISTIDVVFPDPPKDDTPRKPENSKVEAMADKPAGQEEKSGKGGVINGKATYLPKPAYPTAAERERISGEVSIEVVVAEDGSIISAHPAKGNPILAEAARIAACKATFSPTLLSGLPVKVSGIITYNFVGPKSVLNRRRN